MAFGKSKKKMIHHGFALFIRREKEKSFNRVGFLFGNRDSAREYGKAHFPTARVHVEGVRVDHTPIDFPPPRGR